MAKEKVTLTLDAESLAALRSLVGSRSLSSTIDAAVAKHLAHLRHMAAVDEWLAEMEEKHGAVPQETLEWAAQIFDSWEVGKPAAAGREAV
ncbi:CopG family transcriptional regulator [Nocardioides speluncae]|uniref:CopG family transcriptional regulator n=1 Tax=Nocardioides speluncae TaxID=2670337 RepID=UPI000D69D2EF|nr:CopG family transcriptional regulator [Nocardioides speluncae]